jgi:hypothetical protein
VVSIDSKFFSNCILNSFLHGQQKLPVISRWRNKTKEKGGCIVQNNLNKWPVDFHDFYGGCAAAPVKVEFMIQKINILEG